MPIEEGTKGKTLGELVKAKMDKEGFDTTGVFDDDSETIPFDEPEEKVEVKETTEDVVTPEPEQKEEKKEVEPPVVESEMELEANKEDEISESTQEKIVKDETPEDLKKLTAEELADKKKEYDKYNTQNAQRNAEAKKLLEQRQDDLIAAEGRMREMLDRMEEKTKVEKVNLDETEYEMLNRKLGTDFDELSSNNEIVLAKRQLAFEETKAQEIESDRIAKEKQKEEWVKANIRQQQKDWETFSKEKEIPESMHEPILSILFAKRQQIPNFTLEQAHESLMGSYPYNKDKEAFLKFAKGSKWAADLKAVFLEEAKLKRNEAGTVIPPKGGVVPEKENKLKKGWGTLERAKQAALDSWKGK